MTVPACVSNQQHPRPKYFKMDFIQILLILTQIIFINSEKCSNESELCDIDSEKEITLGFYEVPQISHYEEGLRIKFKLSALLKKLT